MGWCREFGPQIEEGCSHPMVAEAACCTCRECGAICRGRFNGCPTVWAAALTGPAPARSPYATTEVFAPAALEANPLAKRPKHRNKRLARARAGSAVVERSSSSPASEPVAAPASAASSALPPPPQSLAEIRQRLEGIRGRMKVIGERPKAGDWT